MNEIVLCSAVVCVLSEEMNIKVLRQLTLIQTNSTPKAQHPLALLQLPVVMSTTSVRAAF